MTVQEVANRLVELCRQGQNMQAIEELYADDIVSLEPEGSQAPRVEGKANVIEKEKGFFDMVEEMHGAEISDPIVASDFFSVTMSMDLTMKGMPRFTMEEVCVYGVKDGKINFEQFFFTPQMG